MVSMRSTPCRQPHRGFALLEVLIALIVFSVAALGLVGLQATMTKATTGAQFRANAAYLASDLIGRLWSDTGHLSSYASGTCTSYAPCKSWLDKVAATLPGGTAVTTIDATAGTVTIALTWQMPGEDTHRLDTTSAISPNTN